MPLIGSGNWVFLLEGLATHLGNAGNAGPARLLPLHGGLHGHRGHDPDRLDGRAVEVEAASSVWGLFCGAIYYPLFAAWTWGGGWLAKPGTR